MAYIERKKNGSVRIVVSGGYDSNGKQIRCTRTIEASKLSGLTERQREKEIERQKVLFEQKVEGSAYLDGEKITLGEFVEKWMVYYAEKQLAPSTLKDYKFRLRHRIIPVLGHIKLSKLQPHHLIEFYNNISEIGMSKAIYYIPTQECISILSGLKPAVTGISPKTLVRLKQGKQTTREIADKVESCLNRKELFTVKKNNLSGKTVKHHHDLICSILSTAVKWNIIATNPAERLTPPKVKKNKPLYYEEKDLTRLLQLLNGEPITYRTLIFLAIDTGLREGELTGLRWDDIDFNHNRLNVSNQRQYISGYGVIDKPPKTEAGIRPVTVSPTVLILLKAYRKVQKENRLLMGNLWKDTPYVFIHDDGSPLHPHRPYKWFMEFLQRHKLPKITFHSLRHTNASMMISQGADVVTVSGRLGHSDKRVTLNVYSHMFAANEEMVANKMNDFYERIL